MISFCVGTGRCGTTFLAKLAALEPHVAASHERLRLPATFHMFCKWHGIPVDPEGFLSDREAAIRDDLRAHRVSFEASALLSHSLLELHERFAARFLLLVRHPVHTVGSFAVRGWFVEPIPWRDPALPPTIREGVEPRHFFGRNLPRGEEFARWTRLSQIGRIAWFWQARNRGILDQFRELPASDVRIARLEDLDFEHYAALAPFLGWTPTIDRAQFAALAASRPNAGAPVSYDWDARAREELEAEVAPLASALGYDLHGSTRTAVPRVEQVLAALT